MHIKLKFEVVQNSLFSIYFVGDPFILYSSLWPIKDIYFSQIEHESDQLISNSHIRFINRMYEAYH